MPETKRSESSEDRRCSLPESNGAHTELLKMLDRMADAIQAFDTEWRMTYLNAQAERLLQRSADELIGRVVWDEFPEGDAFREQYEHAMREQVPVSFREHYRPLDIWFEVRAYPSEAGLTVHFTDVTQMVHAEHERRESELHLRATFDQAAVGLAHVGLDGRWLRVNERLAAITGYSREELAGLTFQEITHPDDLDADLEQASALAAGRIASYGMDKRYIRKDGTVAWVRLTVSIVRNDDGTPLFFVSVIEDIGAQKQAEQQLLEALVDRTRLAEQLEFERERLSAVFSSMHESVGLWSPDGMLLDTNEATARMHGFESTEQMLRHLSEYDDVTLRSLDGRVLPREDWPAARMVRGEAFTDVIVKVEVSSTGARFTGSYSGTPIKGDNGEMVLGVITLHDVTELYKARSAAERELERAQLLVRAADVLSSSMEPAEVLDRLARLTAEATGRARAVVGLYDEGCREFVVGAQTCEAGLAVGERHALADLAPEAAVSVTERRPVVADFESEAMPGSVRSRAARTGCRLALMVPVTSGDEVVGQVIIDEPGARRPFSEAEIATVEGIASQAAVAIRNARLYEGERVARHYAEALNAINELVHSTLDIDLVMQQVVESAAVAAGLELVAVQLREASGWRFKHAHGIPDDLRDTVLSDDEARLSAQALSSGETVSVSAESGTPVFAALKAEDLGVCCMTLLPLTARGARIGVLVAGLGGTAGRIGERRSGFLRSVVSTISLALQNARQYEIEYRISQKLQEALLALPDEVPGIEFAHAYHSATEAARVGGDFYDVFEVGHHYIGITMGDVAGKGLDAAVLTSLVKNTVRAHAAEPGRTPAAVLKLANDVVFKATPPEAFVTLLFGMLDRRDGRFVYANAGHSSAVVATDDGIAFVRETGPLLGAFEGALFGMREVRLAEGDRLVLCTDGLIEARCEGELFGETRFGEVVEQVGDCSPEDLVEALVMTAMDFAGGVLRDDLAVLAICRTPWCDGVPMQQKLEL